LNFTASSDLRTNSLSLSENDTVTTATLAGIVPCSVQDLYFDKLLVLPIAVIGVLLEQPLLQTSLLDVALDDQNVLHKLVIDYKRVDLSILAWNSVRI